MDNNDVKPEEQNAGTGQVMDIQPPKPVTSVPVTDTSSSDPGLATSSLASETAPEVAVAPPEEPSTETPTTNEGEQPALPAADTNPLAIPPTPVKKAGTPKAIIIMAVLIALTLAGLSVFAYTKTSKQTKAPSTQQSTQSPTVTSSDVDKTTEEVDSTINQTDDAKDFSENELSDQSLGL